MIDERFPNWDVDVEKGTIYSLRFKRNIGSIDKDGYVKVFPPKGYKHNCFHQYIWMVANGCDIPKGYDIHHMDGNKLNNSIYNLELVEHILHIVEHKQNISEETKKKMSESKKGKKSNFDGKHHSEETKNKMSKQVAQYTLDGELVKVWISANECGRNGFDQGNVSACCQGKRKTHNGFIWKYYDEKRDVA